MTVIAICKIEDAGYSVAIKDKICKIKNQKSGKTIGRIPQSANGLYQVDHPITIAAVQDQIDILMLHCRLGHISADAICTLTWANVVTGLHLIDPNATFTCDSCDHAKTTHKIIHKVSEASPAQSFSNEIHTDIWGPAPISTIGGCKYYVTFTDDHTHYTWLELLHSKDQAFKAYKTFGLWAQMQHWVKIKRLRSDHGGKYTSNNFTDFLKLQGTE